MHLPTSAPFVPISFPDACVGTLVYPRTMSKAIFEFAPTTSTVFHDTLASPMEFPTPEPATIPGPRGLVELPGTMILSPAPPS